MNTLNTMKKNDTRSTNGGKTYRCPFGCNKSGSYWTVYGHCLANMCFTRNKYLNGLWVAGTTLIKIGAKLGGYIQ